MKRALDGFDASDLLADWQNQEVKNDDAWTTYSCRLVTPLYGGGVQAGEVDREMPIRVPSIRGQLRFWWRIACGPFSSSKEMFTRETAIWGGIGSEGPTASRVAIRIFGATLTDQQLLASNADGDLGVKYAFGPATNNGVAQWVRPGYAFNLSIRCSPAISSDVETSLRWWASFGGIGARTRRGFGAVRVDGVEPVFEDEIKSAGAVIAYRGAGSGSAESEWKRSIGRLFSFRQQAGTGRGIGAQRPSRSYWPEPDQLRRFTHRNANGRHEPRHEANNVFPRAAFGLPILFDFMNAPGEPPRAELLPAGGEDRMASPLILRPYWNGQLWRATALLLPWWRDALAQPLRFKNAPHQPNNWPNDDQERRAIAATIAPMQRNGELRAEDPLSAFMEFFKEP